jgi:hypothetical protein
MGEVMKQFLALLDVHPSLAAWAQAVFSVLAIIAAIGIAMWQRRSERIARLQVVADQQDRFKNAATLAMNGAIETIRQIAGVAAVTPLSVYGPGSLHGLGVIRATLAGIDLSQLGQSDAAAVNTVLRACIDVEGTLLMPISLDNDGIREQLASAIKFHLKKAMIVTTD